MEKARQPLRFVLSSGASFLVDVGLFYILRLLLGGPLGANASVVCSIAARAVSSFFNFNVNRSLVFRGEGGYAQALLRYYLLAVPQLGASTLLLRLAELLFGVTEAGGSTLLKIAVDSFLFLLSYFIQKYWVFGKRKSGGKE